MIEAVHAARFQSAIEQLHHASQFIAMTGKAYLPHQPDDSHTTMQWDTTAQIHWGYWMDHDIPTRIGLDTLHFTLVVQRMDGQEASLPLHLEERSNVESWLRLQLLEAGADPMLWQWDLHYDLPDYAYDQGVPYRKPGQNILRSYAAQRSLTQRVLTNFTQHKICIWPHHFDTGSLLQNDAYTIGLGWAIPDSLSPVPYWYATRYPPPDEWKPMQAPGTWWTPKLQGRALPVDQIWVNPASQQAEHLTTFFAKTIDYYRS